MYVAGISKIVTFFPFLIKYFFWYFTAKNDIIRLETTRSNAFEKIKNIYIIFVFYILDSIATKLPTDKNSCAVFILCVILFLCYVFHTRLKNFIGSSIFCAVGLIAFFLTYFFAPSVFDSAIYKILTWFSLLSHFNNFGSGILNLSDIVYYVSFVILFLYLTINTIEKRRW